MKALAALLCLFIVSVSGLDNESCEDRGNFTLGTLISRPREMAVVHTLADPCVLTNFLSK